MKQERQNLLNWYHKNFRDLPWRNTRDPYKIWISEIMCQQTRVAAVLPYFHKFMNRFPSVEKLAEAPESDVLEYWAGLGYYSRARNVHKSAKLIVSLGFPANWEEWIELPGIGDYCSRAISSFSNHEKVGVLDGNVVRFLSRYYGAGLELWVTEDKRALQSMADEWAQDKPEIVNQALMELGATICLPSNPHCTICPLRDECVARDMKLTNLLPVKKEKKLEEFWTLDFHLVFRGDQMLITKNHGLPVLGNQFLPPCKPLKVDNKPSSSFLFRHSVTHHHFFVSLSRIDENTDSVRDLETVANSSSGDAIWVDKINLKKYCQSSLVDKLLGYV